MAAFQVKLPESFNFSTPDEWTKWIRRFERFSLVSGLSEKSSESQVNTLIYTMGDQADDILSSFGLSVEDAKKYDTVKEKFEGYFIKKRNVIFERAKFNMRNQLEGESVDSFVTELHGLADHCNFRDLKEELIRDRVVVGLRDAALSEKLQMDPDLTLEKAVNSARQKEAVRKQQPLLRGEGTESKVSGDDPLLNVDAIKQGSSSASAKQQKEKKACFRCGRPYYRGHNCPAMNATCRRCNRRGHFQEVCRTQLQIQEVQSPQERDSKFIGVVEEKKLEGNNPWMIEVTVNGSLVKFKVDTGADVTVIPFYMIQSGDVKADLLPCAKNLCGPGNRPLVAKGEFYGQITYNQRATKEAIIVVDGLQVPLLGRPAISRLQLLQRLDNLQEMDGNKISWPALEFPELFTGLGKLDGEYTIKLKSGASPFSLCTSRHVAIPLMPKVKEELKRMQDLGVIVPVEQPTSWCAGMVVVPKTNGTVRICVDLTKLNESVCREKHPIPSVDQTLGQLAGAKFFSKLDANSGFWQVPLSEQSSYLTTFITPFGRFRFTRVPFGITSAPEHFQRRMSALLSGLHGVSSHIDDVLVYGKSLEEHNENLRLALTKISKAHLTLNKDKCKFLQRRINFLGHTIDASGIRPDPDKVQALQNMPCPTNTTEVRRFLGMANQFGKFLPDLANTTKPLRDLLIKDNLWIWSTQQEQAFEMVKQALVSPPVLALYNPNLPTTVSADASSLGLGAVLLQQQENGVSRPVAFISLAMTKTEQMYAQIEKEALAITWACDRFYQYLLGLHFHIQTDHKPLVPLLSSKDVDNLPLRVQRFRLRLMKYNYAITHVPGKELVVADALSCAPNKDHKNEETALMSEEVEYFVKEIVYCLPATEARLEQIRKEQLSDSVCVKLAQYCAEGWPTRDKLNGNFKPYLTVAAELSIKDGLLMRGKRIVIPKVLQQDILNRLHAGHQGIVKCRSRARQSVWWLYLSAQIEEMIRNCPECCINQRIRNEPMIPTVLPERPWQKVGMDLFYWDKVTYLLIVDYYSRFIEVSRLSKESAQEVICHVKSMFARHGIPVEVISDNGPQFACEEFRQFSRKYDFIHKTSSPYYPQGNGEAERAVQTIKSLLKKEGDPYLAMLAYRTTPLSCGYSPAQLLMSRQLRTTVPECPENLNPSLPDQKEVRIKDRVEKSQQKFDYDRRHGVKSLQPLDPGSLVWMTDRKETGKVISSTGPRSYMLRTEQGVYERNRHHLRPIPGTEDNPSSLSTSVSPTSGSSCPNTSSTVVSAPSESSDSIFQATDSTNSAETPNPADILRTPSTSNSSTAGDSSSANVEQSRQDTPRTCRRSDRKIKPPNYYSPMF